jgi:hypothetical protein
VRISGKPKNLVATLPLPFGGILARPTFQMVKIVLGNSSHAEREQQNRYHRD